MSTRSPPRLWPFFLAFAFLLIGWVITLEMFMEPDALNAASAAPTRHLLWWFVPPLALVLGVFVLHWGRKEYRAQQEAKIVQAEQRAKAEREKAEAAAAQAQRDHDRYSLEVYGAGLTVYWAVDDGIENGKVLEAMQQGDPHTPIPPSDPKAYPWSKDEKVTACGVPAYEIAIKEFPEKWEIPFFLGGPSLHEPESADYLRAGLYGAQSGGGMVYHRFRSMAQVYDECPDQLPAELFKLFDEYSDLPAAALAVEDSPHLRQMLQPPHAPPLMRNGYEVPTLMGSATVVILGRRDRVDMLRPTATDTPIKEIQIPFETEPWGRPLPADYVDSYDNAPLEPQLPDHQNHLRPFWEAQGGAPVAFKPSRFVRRPWCKEQLAQFDLLPIRARVHRPQTAEYVKDGKALAPKEREQIFLEAWTKALATLPAGEQPVRVVYDFGPKGATRLPPLITALHAAGPDLDLHGKDGLDVTARLRDTGANGPYVALALGILATEKQSGVSAVVNLRRADRATVIMISPPTTEDKVKRKIHFHSDYLGSINQE